MTAPLLPRGQARPEQAVSALSGDEAASLYAWIEQFGTIHYTREPGEGWTHLRFDTVAIPLAEEFDRQAVSGLRFWRRWAQERVGSNR